jgi:MurNAc alpha-1-phosphate uridylyltransferase
MKALILAAGRGERMRPLSDATPKPLLPVHGKPLIAWHLEALARAGVREVVINTAWLEARFPATLGDGARFGLAIRYSTEGRDHGGALETAGGIAKALPWLGETFWLVSADIYAPDFGFDAATAERFARRRELLGHLWLVPNPPFHPDGDFGLDGDGYALADAAGPDGRRWTYANFALLRAELCRGIAPGTVARLGPLLAAAMRERRITAEVWRGAWHNVGTPAELQALQGAAA